MLFTYAPKSGKANSRGNRCVHVAVEEIDVAVSHTYPSSLTDLQDGEAAMYYCSAGAAAVGTIAR
jgi:hypothetical protein